MFGFYVVLISEEMQGEIQYDRTTIKTVWNGYLHR